MAPDPLTLCLFVFTFLKIGGNLKAARGEAKAYINILAIVVALFESVEATRQTTWCSRAVGAKIDGELQWIRRALHDADRDVIQIAHDAQANDPHPQLGASATLAWTLKYKGVAQANKDLLVLCMSRLQKIEGDLDQASASRSRPQAAEYFKTTRTEMWNALSKRAARQATLYEGKGERLGRRLGL
ncbi:uncharacterized protein PAC_15361 [Phialocephala subalpina]|uniref:Uncharacterized protein n=1 Tax=Phialocephala subalpina TaxID=576137 RepID=A0A1L7XK79_9HELO|nr:uncharacterized protein PAC_15361 [Phialocephala subalpina]